MNKVEATQVMREIEAAVAVVFAAHGLKQKSLRAGFDVGDFSITIKAISTDPGLDPRVTDWNRYAVSYGFPVESLGKVITFRGEQFAIAGLETSRRKFPVVLSRVSDRKVMLTTVVAAKRALGLAPQPWEL